MTCTYMQHFLLVDLVISRFKATSQKQILDFFSHLSQLSSSGTYFSIFYFIFVWPNVLFHTCDCVQKWTLLQLDYRYLYLQGPNDFWFLHFLLKGFIWKYTVTVRAILWTYICKLLNVCVSFFVIYVKHCCNTAISIWGSIRFAVYLFIYISVLLKV